MPPYTVVRRVAPSWVIPHLFRQGVARAILVGPAPDSGWGTRFSLLARQFCSINPYLAYKSNSDELELQVDRDLSIWFHLESLEA